MTMIINFIPNCIIDDHFRQKRTEIDIKMELLMHDATLSEVDREEIIELSLKQLKQIEEIKQFNLSSNTYDYDSFLEKWKDLIENETINSDDKLDIVKIDLIKNDCILLKNDAFKSKTCLWLFELYLNKKVLKVLR